MVLSNSQEFDWEYVTILWGHQVLIYIYYIGQSKKKHFSKIFRLRCMYVSMYICSVLSCFVIVCIYMYVFMYMFICICVYIDVCSSVYIYACLNVFVGTFICIKVIYLFVLQISRLLPPGLTLLFGQYPSILF